MSEYIEQAEQFLTRNGLKFRVVYKDASCPLFCNGKHIHGDRHVCTIWGNHPAAVLGMKRTPKRRVSFQFWNSYNDAQNGNEPNAYDLLVCIIKSDPGTFADFCGEYGYDEDSRKAESVYRAVCREWRKVAKFFTADELEQLQGIS